jgi:hypothetical protein
MLISFIIAISFFGNWYLFETYKTNTISKHEKAIILFLWFLAISFPGYFALKLLNKKWAIIIWVLQYTVVLLLCITYGILYFYASEFPIAIKSSMAAIRNFYLTPVPLALLLIMILDENKKRSNL